MKDISISGYMNISTKDMIIHAMSKGISIGFKCEAHYHIELFDCYYHPFLLHYAYISLEFKYRDRNCYKFDKVVVMENDHFYVGSGCYYFKLVRDAFVSGGEYVDYDILAGCTLETFEYSQDASLPEASFLENYKTFYQSQ